MRNLIVLDIDETLLSSHLWLPKYDIRICHYYTLIRPNLSKFLDFCFGNFLVGIFTAAGKDYAEEVSVRLFPQKPEFILHERNCTLKYDLETHEAYHVKKLDKVTRKGFRKENILVIDNTACAWENSYGNLISVKDFVGDAEDKELLYLMQYLDKIKDAEDYRKLDKRNWRRNYETVD